MHLILMHSKCIRGRRQVSIGNAFDDNFISRLKLNQFVKRLKADEAFWTWLIVRWQSREPNIILWKTWEMNCTCIISDKILRRFCMCSTWLGLCVSSWFWCYYMTLWFCICLLDDKFSLVNPQVGNRGPSRFFFPMWLTKCIVHSLEILIHVSSIYANNVFMVLLHELADSKWNGSI